MAEYNIIIGLEIHAELDTKTKAFVFILYQTPKVSIQILSSGSICQSRRKGG